MANIISMQDIRQLNLFEKVTRIRTRYSFSYNDTLMFAVPRGLISKALGRNNENLRKISGILKKRIRVVAIPDGMKDVKSFVQAVINPVSFNSIEITPDEVIVTAGPQNKAALLGRNKRRLEEMKEIISNFFKLGYRVI